MQLYYYINNSKLIKTWLSLQCKLKNKVRWSDLLYKFGSQQYKLILCRPDYYQYIIENEAITADYVHGQILVLDQEKFFYTFYRINLGFTLWDDIEFVKDINPHLIIEANFVKTKNTALIDIELSIENLTEISLAANC